MLSDDSQVGHVIPVLPLVGCKPNRCSAMVRKWAMFVLTVVVCLPDKLWFSQVGYVCIASGGLLAYTDMVRKWVMFVLPYVGCFHAQRWFASRPCFFSIAIGGLQTFSRLSFRWQVGHVCLNSGGLLT